MKVLKNVEFTKRMLSVINFLAASLYSSVYLPATKCIIENNFNRSLLEKANIIPSSPERISRLPNLFFIGLLLVVYARNREFGGETKVRDWLTALKIILLFATLFALQLSYNGLVLLVFMDIFSSYTDFYAFHGERAWLLLIVASLGALLLSNYDVLPLLMRTPDLDVYANFFPADTRLVTSFVRNCLVSLSMIVFIVSLMTYIIYPVTGNRKIEEELLMTAQTNTHSKEYITVSEKVIEDRERRHITYEIRDTIGHALTGISTGIDAVAVLTDLDPEHAKKQSSSVSNVVCEGIVDVRRSLNGMWPDALENRTLKDTLEKMLSEYQELSHLQIDLNYHWDSADFDKTKKDAIFRVIQESVTDSLRHGRATKISITMLGESDYALLIKDDGAGSETIEHGFGLTQITERLAIIGSHIAFSGKNGFSTTIHIFKIQGEGGRYERSL